MIDIFKKRQRNKVMRKLSQHLKKTQYLSLSDVFNTENLYSVWCHNNISLLTYVQQTHHCECAIWENLNHTLSDIAHYDLYRRVRVNECFITQINSVCTHYMSLHNFCDQCSAESLITTVSIFERSDVIWVIDYFQLLWKCNLSSQKSRLFPSTLLWIMCFLRAEVISWVIITL